jgi:L-lactate permease
VPLWFGLAQERDSTKPDYVSEEDLVRVSQKSAVALAISAFILVSVSMTLLVPWKQVRTSLPFIYLALA